MRARIQSGRRRYYRAGLRAWFERHGRDLPWRRTRDPYRILVSELMLHQTQVPRVAEVYETFLHRFPTIESVAEAPLGEVKAITDPLGYKIRGRWIKQIADDPRHERGAGGGPLVPGRVAGHGARRAS